MADKTDRQGSPDFLSELLRIYSEHQGMKYILQHYGPENWRLLMKDYLSLPKLNREAAQKFHVLRETLQGARSDDFAALSLVEFLNTVNLAKPDEN